MGGGTGHAEWLRNTEQEGGLSPSPASHSLTLSGLRGKHAPECAPILTIHTLIALWFLYILQFSGLDYLTTFLFLKLVSVKKS